ncbi:MAG: bifunctional dihydroorotate dehydrogenase B NAD binding subunit/NADPH-dependent glutamate synthase [Ruminococcaceae bacterium]|nr:bifunctional dihydroorotate dehydrogenase B NAD binding subunit/NADPH-dependent glutamate synthase [Oscillospiraceae bacterium]
MFKIAEKRELNASMTLIKVVAPHIAEKALPGQFIIFRVDEQGERVPLTIADCDKEQGTVTIIFQKVGKSTHKLGELNEGDSIADFVGPLGKPTELEGYKRVAVIGGGAGCAIAYPQAKHLHANGAEVDMIAGFRNKDIIILEEEMAAVCSKLMVMTDDGSNGNKGFVTNALKEQLEAGVQYELVIAIGPLPMMKAVCNLTKEYGIKTIVSMNPIMIDGTGMCGGCRLTVGGETKFACVDGPDFDGHQVDFDAAMKRLGIYRDLEQQELADHEAHVCRLTGTVRSHEAPEQPAEAPDVPEFARNMSLQKNPMPEQAPEVRRHNFEEVAMGYTAEMAIDEARRCLNCKNKPCVNGCPVNVRIPEFIAKVAVGDFAAAYEIISSTNALPAVCGRVCPQETQCENQCVRGIKGEPVAIGRLERFVADWHMKNGEQTIAEITPNGHKVAVIGSGPSGLTCAGDLAKKGFDVTVYEALHMAGGVLMYGIPEFRLPKAIVQKEVDSLRKLGVHFMTNMVIGKVLSIDELIADKGYEAIFVGSGAGLPSFMGLEGENLLGVYSANEFLTRINLMKAYREEYDTVIRKPKKVAVIGGGNVAMDAARCALRLGAEEVSIIYRRSEAEMPARAEEIHHAKEEGVTFRLLNNPTRILGDEADRVVGIECVEMELGEPDASGRRRPIARPGSEFQLEVDCVVIAVGNTPNPLISMTTKGIEVNRKGCLVVDEDTLRTTREKVYAGGDIVTGAATVILAMGAGKKAARSICDLLGVE